MDEIKDTEIDRAAVRSLLALNFDPIEGIDLEVAPIAVVNDLWSRMARKWAAATDEEFDRVLQSVAPLNVPSERKGDPVPPPTPQARARELLALIVDWRHGTWEAAEIAAGRDPHQVA